VNTVNLCVDTPGLDILVSWVALSCNAAAYVGDVSGTSTGIRNA